MLLKAEDTKEIFGSVFSTFGAGKRIAKKVTIIQNFPIPNTKEDLVEFLTIASSSANVGSNANAENKKLAEVWRIKCAQIVEKARYVFRNDPQTLEFFNQTAKKLHILEHERWYHKLTLKKILIWTYVITCISIAVLAIIS